jgi:alpha-N-arabinofuranosidase
MSDKTFQISVNPDQVQYRVSDTLFGIFIEDLNYTCDGGINANMVMNNSYDAIYMGSNNFSVWAMEFGLRGSIDLKPDRLRNWIVSGGTLESLHETPISENSWYARVQANGKCRLENLGYNGFKKNLKACAMSIVEGKEYEFSCFIRRKSFEGMVSVFVEDENGKVLTDEKGLEFGPEWSHVKVTIYGKRTDYGKLVLIFKGKGTVDIDCVSLLDADTWGKGDPKWSQGRLRKDLVEVLRDLKPTFLRFPGGSLTEGTQLGCEYRWKDTIGPIVNRKNTINLWASFMPKGEYLQSFQVGFYEYFLLCEDLQMQPVPVVWAGISLRKGEQGRIPMNTPEFSEKVIQNALDLIDYANGDPTMSHWAKIRADAGHPAPFNMKYIGIGNENPGEDYLKRFAIIEKAIKEKYPEIICIMSSGLLADGKDLDNAWKLARENYPTVLVDEHFYGKPEAIIKRQSRYDSYPRNSAKVFLGEYAAHSSIDSISPLPKNLNNFESALGEAVFMTGLERNSDVVAMTCYAPLFSLVGGEQWAHNLINFNPAHVLKTTNYFVQKMFSSNIGTEVVEMQGELPNGVYGSATASKDRLIVKLVNTNSHNVQAHLNFLGIVDGTAQVEYMQSDDLRIANTMKFKGSPEYLIEPKTKEMTIKDSAAVLDIKPYGVYIIIINK